MFSTRKRKYNTISEIGNHKKTQTIYVGKKPFLLRIYNKKEELKKSNKKDLMDEYFANHNFDLEDEIFNIEFELHRTHLKQFNIDTVKDLLINARKLFRLCMDDIRVIDTSSISKSDLEHNRYKADTLPMWKYIKFSYDLKDFLETTLPLERIKRKISIYDDFKFQKEIIAVIRRAYINNLTIDDTLLFSLHGEARQSLTKTTTSKEIKKRYIDIDYELVNKEKEHYRLLEDGTVIKPVNVIAVHKLDNYELLKYIDTLMLNKDRSEHEFNLWSIAYREAVKRKLIPIIGSEEAEEKDE